MWMIKCFVPGLLFLCLISGCETEQVKINSDIPELKLLTIQELNDSIQINPRQLTLINFYATWCRPCVREIPDLLSIADEYKDQMRLMMVSIDDSKVIEQKLPAFVSKYNIIDQSWFVPGDSPESVALILSLLPQWNRSIPVSLLYAPDGRLIHTYSGQIDPEKLRSVLKTQDYENI